MKIEDLPRPAHYRRQMTANGGYEMVPAYTAEEVLGILEGVWIKTQDQMPPSGQTVLAYYINQVGNGRRVRAQWIAAKSCESGSESDIGEYDEETDTYYDPEGWYEQIDNWDTYSAVGICGVTVTHWMPLPKAP